MFPMTQAWSGRPQVRVKISWIPIKEELMIKERAWPVRAMYMLIAAALVISLIIVAAPTQKVAADPGLSEWSKVSTPSELDWVLAPGSTITGFAPSATGVIYAIVVTAEGEGELLPYYLLKSTDQAATWKDISKGVKTEIDKKDLGDLDILVSVACDFGDPDFVAVAIEVTMDADPDEVHVLISDDGGTTFRDTGEVDIPANGIYDFAISSEGAGVRNLVIGGTNAAANDARLFRCQAIGDIGTGWTDTTLYDGWDDDPDSFTSRAVVDIWFAPSWATDRTILVLTVPSTNNNVHLQSGTWGTVEGWNEEAGFEKAVAILTAGKTIPYLQGVAGINTPFDYSGQDAGKRYVWVNVNYLVGSTQVGEIFRVKNKSVLAINQQVEGQPWLTNVSYFGYISEGKAIASLFGDGTGDPTECCDGVQVYRNDSITNMDICCLPWDAACKPPTGRLLMVVFYISPDKAYGVSLFGSAYDESAWSVSFDDGDTWNQLSLVNTWIDYLSDVAVSPDCNKTMLVSVNIESGCECDSVWLYADNLPEASEYSDKWLRTWCGHLEGDNSGDDFLEAPEIGFLRLAPEETTGDTVYLVDRMSSTIYWNELETLACWKVRGATTIVNDIVDLALKDESTIYALDISGAVAVSDDHGAAPSWTKAVDSKVNYGWTIAVWGEDILVGGRDGDVSHSADGGETFTELEDIATSGLVTVAFDSYFDTNDTIFAALYGAGTDNGIYRWVIGESTEWVDLQAEPYDYTGLVLDRPAPGNPMTAGNCGVLYASYVTEIGGDIVTGAARCLTPCVDVICAKCIEWDYLTQGLTPDEESFFMMPDALKICGCLTADSNTKLFAIDALDYYDMEKGRDGTVWTFEDCYSKAAPTLATPAEDAVIPSDPCFCYNLEVVLEWARQCDACSYDIQVALDEDFNQLVTLVGAVEYTPPNAENPTYVIAMGDLNCDHTYYWRVRSADASTGQIIHSWWSASRSFSVAPGPGTGISLITPAAGATNVPITNIAFTWEMVASADNYDWVLSKNTDMSAPVETKTGLTTAAYTCTKTLEYNTPYYWRVTAYKDGAMVDDATGTFTTRPVVPPPPDTEPISTPTWVWVIIAIGAVLVIVVIVLIFRTRRV